jgi:hypothetical protein
MPYKTLLGHKDDSVYQQCLDIRIAVFVDEQKFTMEDELDELSHSLYLPVSLSLSQLI